MSATSTEPIRVGVVGLGYWGPNLARNFAAIAGCELRGCATPASRRARDAARAFPERARDGRARASCSTTRELDAVVLATPVPTHAELAIAVAQAGKHCFVEKPLATSAARRRARGRGGRAGRAGS